MYGVTGYTPVEHLVTGPALEPLDLDETKKMLQFASDEDDTLIDIWISAARQRFEDRTGRQIMLATWELWLDRFPFEVELPRAPLMSVSSIKYIDTDGNLQTLSTSNYIVKMPAGPQCDRGWLVQAYGTTWPSIRCESGAVRIQYISGYGDTLGSVPELVRSALYLLVSDFHCSRCAAENKPAPKKPIGMDDLLNSFVLRCKRPLRDW